MVSLIEQFISDMLPETNFDPMYRSRAIPGKPLSHPQCKQFYGRYCMATIILCTSGPEELGEL
jgi:hypothetical protein